MKTIKKINNETIEVIEEISQTNVQRLKKNALIAQKKLLEDQILEIEEYLLEFDK